MREREKDPTNPHPAHPHHRQDRREHRDSESPQIPANHLIGEREDIGEKDDNQPEITHFDDLGIRREDRENPMPENENQRRGEGGRDDALKETEFQNPFAASGQARPVVLSRKGCAGL